MTDAEQRGLVRAATVVVLMTPVLTPYVSGRAGDSGGLLRVQVAGSLSLGLGKGAAGFVSTAWACAAVAVPVEVAWYVAAGEVVGR